MREAQQAVTYMLSIQTPLRAQQLQLFLLLQRTPTPSKRTALCCDGQGGAPAGCNCPDHAVRRPVQVVCSHGI
jgi:hypothetical protein